MIVALSGTPGTGKTRAAELLDRDLLEIMELGTVARDYIDGFDDARQSAELDVERLVKDISSGTLKLPLLEGRATIIEGHLSHLLPVDLIIVLRTSTIVLRERLLARGYPEEKIRENLEAEALGVVSLEAFESGIPMYELDTGIESAEGTAAMISGIIGSPPEPVKELTDLLDYSEEIMEWY